MTVRAGSLRTMRWLPLVVQAAVAALLLASIVRSFLGPPPPRARLTTALVLLGAAGAVLTAGAVALLHGWSVTGTALSVLGVELACASAWLGRGPLGPGRGPDRSLGRRRSRRPRPRRLGLGRVRPRPGRVVAGRAPPVRRALAAAAAGFDRPRPRLGGRA